MIELRNKYLPIIVILFIILIYFFPDGDDILNNLKDGLTKISYESEIEVKVTNFNWANGLLLINNKYYASGDAAVYLRKKILVTELLDIGDKIIKNQNSDTLIIVKNSGQRYVFEKYFKKLE